MYQCLSMLVVIVDVEWPIRESRVETNIVHRPSLAGIPGPRVQWPWDWFPSVRTTTSLAVSFEERLPIRPWHFHSRSS